MVAGNALALRSRSGSKDTRQRATRRDIREHEYRIALAALAAKADLDVVSVEDAHSRIRTQVATPDSNAVADAGAQSSPPILRPEAAKRHAMGGGSPVPLYRQRSTPSIISASFRVRRTTMTTNGIASNLPQCASRVRGTVDGCWPSRLPSRAGTPARSGAGSRYSPEDSRRASGSRRSCQTPLRQANRVRGIERNRV